MELKKTMTEVTFSIIKIGVTAYIGLCLFVFLRQSSYVYFPEKWVGLTPDYYHIGYETLTLRTGDGETISAWYVPYTSSQGHTTGNGDRGAGEPGEPESQKPGHTILFCHGNAGNIGDRIDSIKTFHSMGFNVLIFDYRGYGDSSGKPTEDGTYSDAKAAWDYLTVERDVSPDRIVIFGRSLGGAVATWLAGEVRPGALVIESVFTSAPDMAANMFPFLPVRLVCRFKYDSLAQIRMLSCPVLIAHSRNDDMIPYEHGRRLFNAAKEPKRFVEMTGLHNSGGLDADPDYQHVFRHFLDLYLTGSGD